MKRMYWVFCACLLPAPYGVSAALQVFTNKADFLAAAGPDAVTEDFSTAPLGTIFSGETPMLGTLRFSYEGGPDDGNGDPFNGQPLVKNNGDVNGTREFMGEVNADGTPSGLHYFMFPEAMFAFGGDFDGAVTGSFLTVSAAGQTVNLSTYLPRPGTGFFGFTSSIPFESITFGSQKSTGSEVFRLDDVVYAPPEPEPEVSPVPLPASFWFLFAGAGLFASMRKFRLQKNPSSQT
ncbi:hypothetical protein [Sulfitobacter sp. JL08]|uniref:hypothetical protein n=1 Tax=Sulfitobacter sp. JL08 TaxID=2070369 RepID=UPI0019634823|nr:hypothetical protein [Sulfitobacter sp. JL08]